MIRHRARRRALDRHEDPRAQDCHRADGVPERGRVQLGAYAAQFRADAAAGQFQRRAGHAYHGPCQHAVGRRDHAGVRGHTTFGNRPTGIVIPRYRNMEAMDGIGHTRGFSFQGGALQSTWTQGKRLAGIGADYKTRCASRAVAHGAGGLCRLRAARHQPPDAGPRELDANGLPQLKVDFAFGKEEMPRLAAKAEAAEMLTAAGGQVIMGFDRPGPGGTAIHEMGGARMGHDPQDQRAQQMEPGA
jgi:hypothetical protein